MKQSIENLYQLDGRVPLGKALPFGLQHVLAMFVSNITPIMILASVVGLDSAISAALIQNCMVIAGIGTLVQLFPVWRIGSRLPIVMGISFTFLSLAISIAGAYGMGTLIGAVIVGGLVEGVLGLFVLDKAHSARRVGNGRYCHRLLAPAYWCQLVCRRSWCTRFRKP